MGETVIDLRDGKAFIGGSVLNTAKAAARQGACTAYLSEVSSDEYGQAVLMDIIDNCLLFEPSMCNSPFSTMTAKAIVQNGTVDYEFSKEDSTAVNINSEKILAFCSTNSSIDCVFTGSVAFAAKTSRKEILRAVDSIGNPFIFFDPNVRPSLIDDVTDYKTAVMDFVKRTSLVRCSSEDLEFLGYDEQTFFSCCGGELIVTRGSEGSTWYRKNGKTFKVKAEKVENLQDTIGCGDVFNGTVLAYFDKHSCYKSYTDEDVVRMLVLASHAAALNCLKEGCCPPYESELAT